MAEAATTIKIIGIVGAGQMGSGIAHVAALAGYDVYLADLDQKALDRAAGVIDKNLSRQVKSGKIKEADKNAAEKRIKSGTAFDRFKDCDVVIEAATENEAVKREVYKKLMPNLKPSAIVASNTSSISITRLAATTDRPGKFIGMHFMNPVPVMTLVELIGGIATDESTFAAVRELAVKLGKTPVAAEDFPAFIVNRILLPMINEAVYTLYEGVGSDRKSTRLNSSHPS